ncbi:MAG: hypothetical protein F6K42_25995 [Leptolyngbya sp. SIO1D8]|nr:hypothetical protein [Leptolyngbya sp. SIO1D8]
MKHQALILQTSPAEAIVPPDVGMLDELGLLGVITFLVVKEAASWFRAKEAAEDQLVATLVSDLRTTQKDLLEKLFELHNQQHEDLAAVRAELEKISGQIEGISNSETSGK